MSLATTTRRFVVGTAGHVDHGKTTLVQALTGVDTDRLPEEKRRGITIELGFASWPLGEGVVASVVDVPGHRRLVHTMIAGAVGMELVVLVVAADEGVMPQTREHIAACEILGIKRVVVAITKLDRVDRELAELAGAEVSELLGERFEHECVLVSAKTGEGLPELVSAVRRRLLALPPPLATKVPHLCIDRAFSIKGAGSVVTGTLVRGELTLGSEVRIVGDKSATSSVRGLHVHDHAVTRVEAPSRVAVNLASIALEELSRGDVLTSDPALAVTRRFDAELRLLRTVKPGALLEVYVGTARSPGKLQLLVPADEESGRPALGRVRLDRPLPVTGGDRFVLRAGQSKGPSGAVLGGGIVLDAKPPPLRSKPLRRAALLALQSSEPDAVAKALLLESAPRALGRGELQARFSVEPALLLQRLEKAADRGEMVRLKEEGFVDRAALGKLAENARKLTAQHHAEAPLERGIKLETLRQKLALRSSASVAAEAIRLAARKGGAGEPIVVEGDIARLVDFAAGALPAVKGPTGEVVRLLAEVGLKGMGEFALLEGSRLTPKELRTILSRLVKEGLVITVGEQWFDARAVASLRGRLVEHFANKPVLTIAEFKELSGLGRKQAIPLLELFDRDGLTLRRGDDRAPGPKAAR